MCTNAFKNDSCKASSASSRFLVMRYAIPRILAACDRQSSSNAAASPCLAAAANSLSAIPLHRPLSWKLPPALFEPCLRMFVCSWLFQRVVNFLQQCVASYRLTQESGRTCIHHQIAKWRIAVGSNENNGNLAVGVEKIPLHLDPTHPRQTHIQD